MMEVRINGELRQIQDATSIEALLRELGIENRNLAIELNGAFVEDDQLDGVRLQEGDTVEIVRFVGGG